MTSRSKKIIGCCCGYAVMYFGYKLIGEATFESASKVAEQILGWAVIHKNALSILWAAPIGIYVTCKLLGIDSSVLCGVWAVIRAIGAAVMRLIN